MKLTAASRATAPCSTGDKVTLVRMEHHSPIPKGSTGTVTKLTLGAENRWTVSVNWDNGHTLALIYPVDKFTVEKKGNEMKK